MREVIHEMDVGHGIKLQFAFEGLPEVDDEGLAKIRQLLIDEGQGPDLRTAVANLDAMIERRKSDDGPDGGTTAEGS